jgi:Dyp-type peroxidase family
MSGQNPWSPAPPVPGGPPAGPPGLPLRVGPAADDIQGNILAGFNKDHQTFVFLRFPNGAGGRAWLGELLPRVATTAQVATFNEQFSAARRARGGDDPEQLTAVWVNVGLTHAGLLKLAPHLPFTPGDFASFTAGPEARAGELRDQGPSEPSRWVIGRAEQRLDALLLVAADETDDLRVELDKMRALAAKHGLVVVFEQRGDTLSGNRAGHEHFGFKDGISQPGIVGFHEADPDKPSERKDHPGDEMIAAGEFVLGPPRAGGDPAPRPHPDWMANGAFQVFRRLRQDVPGWWAQVTTSQESLPADDPMTADLLAAKLVGRWRSGTPLAQAPDRDNRSSRNRARDNDFDYADDPDGHKTPRAAHIRKMYPRDDATFGDDRRRILRRGIPFGRPFDPAGGRGRGVDADRGLLFQAYMTSIEEQFEFLQQSWANFAQFPGVVVGDNRTDGPDPVIGEDPAPVELRRAGRPDEHLDFRRFVHTSGAVYAFAPSLSTLRLLADGEL